MTIEIIKNSTGIRERLTKAKNETEISSLLEEGKGYKYVSEKTKRSWQRTANNRLNSFIAETTKKVKK